MIVTGETPKYMDKFLPHCYCSYHKFHKQWPGVALRRNCKVFLFCFRSVHVGTSSQNSPVSKFLSVRLRQGCQTYGTRHSMPSQSSGSVSILWKISVYIHIFDCVQTVYKSPLLPINTASKTFLPKSGAVRSVDWIFIVGAPACRWLGEYLQEVVADPVTAKLSSLSLSSTRPLLETQGCW